MTHEYSRKKKKFSTCIAWACIHVLNVRSGLVDYGLTSTAVAHCILAVRLRAGAASSAVCTRLYSEIICVYMRVHTASILEGTLWYY